MLGVYLSPDDVNKTQMKISLQKAKEFHGRIQNSSVSQKDKWVAITTVIEPAITYPLLNIYYSEQQTFAIDSILSQIKCSALGLNCNFPRAVLHGPLSLGGIGVPSAKKIQIESTTSYLIFASHLSFAKN